jgi:RimJ/RimL family protein N-acetyltransferase
VRDLEMLQIEMDLLWAAEAGPELVIACATDGTTARMTSGVPRLVGDTVHAEIQGAAPCVDLEPPPLVERLRVALEDALGTPVQLTPGSGPSYVIDHPVALPSRAARLVRSDSPEAGTLREANPGNWEQLEWQDLLEGRLGPWVMAMAYDQVVSICHTPLSNAHAAEAGTWTHPAFRGQGFAAACTANWATLLRPSGRLLFYSTSRTNFSSQRVAQRLGLRQIGCLWQLSRRSD